MTPAPEHWRRWKRRERAMTLAQQRVTAEKPAAALKPGQAANDRRFSRAVLRVAALVAAMLAVAAFAWALLSASSEVEHGIADGTRRVSAELACWVQAHRVPRLDRDRTGQCQH